MGTEQNELNALLKKNYKYPNAFIMDSKLGLVKDLQFSAIATTNRAIERKIKIANLKNMAKTIMYVEEHGYENRTELNLAYDACRSKLNSSRKALKRSEDGIKALNEQIHYTGQYLSNKGTYQAYMKAKNKARFRSNNEAKIILYESARKYLKEHANAGTLPSLAYIKSAPGKFVSLERLKAKRSELIDEQKQLRKAYHSAKNAEKKLALVKKNVDTILKEPELYNKHKKHKNKDIDK